MKEQLGGAVKRLKDRTGGASEGELGRLRRRIKELEDEVQENRRLNRRVAELLDIVEELCDRSLLLSHGRQLAFGPTQEVLAAYRADGR